MIDILNQLVADKCEVWLFHTYNAWNVHLKTERDNTKLEIKETDPDLQEAFDKALVKFRRITGAAPELLPPRLSAPEPIPETPFVELNDEIPF